MVKIMTQITMMKGAEVVNCRRLDLVTSTSIDDHTTACKGWRLAPDLRSSKSQFFSFLSPS